MKIEWTDECLATFDKIKKYLLNLLILVPLMPGHPLILHLAMQEASKGCMSGQLNEPDQKEKVIYYLSKKFNSCEINYIAIKKTCYALAWALRKLWQYMLYFTTQLFPWTLLSTSLKSFPSQGRSPIGKCCSQNLISCL